MDVALVLDDEGLDAGRQVRDAVQGQVNAMDGGVRSKWAWSRFFGMSRSSHKEGIGVSCIS